MGEEHNIFGGQPTEEPATVQAVSVEDYEGMTADDLSVLINTRGIALKSGATKAQMITALKEHANGT